MNYLTTLLVGIALGILIGAPIAITGYRSGLRQRGGANSPTWYCGCGHTNGCNLALCAACGRKANGELPG